MSAKRQVGPSVSSTSAPLGVSVGITNTRTEATKRGIAVEVARLLAATVDSQVCLVGADPIDRDVERRTPALIAADADYTSGQVRRGLRTMDVAFLRQQRLCVVSLPDRVGVDSVLPELREMFRYIVLDAPPRVGRAIGIGHTLPAHLDALVVASGFAAGELALTRVYVEALAEMPRMEHLDLRVVLSGHAHDSGLAPDQLERRLESLPVLATIPRLWGRPSIGRAPPTRDELDQALRPVIQWITDLGRNAREQQAAVAAPAAGLARRHVAAQTYGRAQLEP